MRTSTGICSGGSRTFGRCFARSTTAWNAVSRLKRSTSSSGSYSSPAIAATRSSGRSHCAARSCSRSCSSPAAALNFWCSSSRRTSASRGIFLLAFDARGRFRPRQQRLRLDVDERRRHHQELAGDVEVQLLHQLDRVEVLRGDQRDRDVVDVDLVPPDEVQQQIERAFEVLEVNRQGVDRRFEVGSVIHISARSLIRDPHRVAHTFHRLVRRRPARASTLRRGSLSGGRDRPAPPRAARGSVRGAR